MYIITANIENIEFVLFESFHNKRIILGFHKQIHVFTYVFPLFSSCYDICCFWMMNQQCHEIQLWYRFFTVDPSWPTDGSFSTRTKTGQNSADRQRTGLLVSTTAVIRIKSAVLILYSLSNIFRIKRSLWQVHTSIQKLYLYEKKLALNIYR